MSLGIKGESEIGETRSGSPISSGYDNQVCSVPLCLFPLKCRYHGTSYCHKHFYRQYMRDKRGKPTDPRYFLGMRGESAVRDIFLRWGRKVEDQDSKCKFDFLVDGLRVEVKTVSPHKKKHGWHVNFQRNGILDEHTDFYVVRLENQYEPLHILIPAPVGKTGIFITRGPALWQRYADFQAFARGQLTIS